MQILRPLRLSKETLIELKDIRQHLHRHPEVSNNEKNTSQFVADYLNKHSSADQVIVMADYGIVALFDSDSPGPTVMIRGDMDALPIHEISDIPHRSTIDGVGHMCGHDGHTTILLGLSRALTHSRPSRGRVLLLFQPGEENGTGAKSMLNDPKFDFGTIDYVFALHNIPGAPMHQILVKDGAFTPHVNSLIIKLKGKSAHAAEPEHGTNPAQAIADIITVMEKSNTPDTTDPEFYLISPIYIHSGELAYGITSHEADIRYTMRSWTTEVFYRKSELLLKEINTIAKDHGLKLETSWTQEFYANQNDAKAVSHIRAAATQNGFELKELTFPFKWGEDFGLFTQRYAGAMFGIGSGEDCPALHNPDYDYPDEITETAVTMFMSIISDVLSA